MESSEWFMTAICAVNHTKLMEVSKLEFSGTLGIHPMVQSYFCSNIEQRYKFGKYDGIIVIN